MKPNDAKIIVPLASFARISSGYPLRYSAEDLSAGDIGFVQLKNVSLARGIDWDGVARIELPSKRNQAWLTQNDVIFSARGSRTLAYPVIDPPDRTVCAPQFYVVSVTNTAKILPEFLAWQMNQRAAQDYFQREATGSYILNIRRSVLEQLPIAAPPLREQELIVAYWRAAQRERLMLERLIETTEAQLGAIAMRLATNEQGRAA